MQAKNSVSSKSGEVGMRSELSAYNKYNISNKRKVAYHFIPMFYSNLLFKMITQ